MTGAANANDDQESDSLNLFQDLCRVAHRCWREKQIREGWRSGPFDEEAKVHDALVPYEKLSKRDLHALEVAVEAEEIDRMLSGIIEYERGLGRLFMIDEMQPGMRVGMARCDGPSESEDILGSVMSWQMDTEKPSELGFIEVRWDDGVVREYHPESRELRRLDG